MNRTSRATAALTIAIALAAAGCGSKDDTAAGPAPAAPGGGTTTSEAAEDVTEYCDAVLAVETVGEPDIDFETATEEEIAEGVKRFTTEEMLPLANEALEAAPSAISADVSTLVVATSSMANTGDFMVFEDPKVAAAEEKVHAFDLANCGWGSVPITTVDYRFEDLPTTIEAGPTSFDLSNEGTDVHELVLFRKNDGVTLTAQELLALPEEEVETKTTMIGVGGPTAPGTTAYLVADLEPGDYVALCFLPVGMKGMDGPPPDGPPHFMEGMVAELTVT